MELIFEIGCEELPARFIDPALAQMTETFREACQKARLDCGELHTYGTPRRLALHVPTLADGQPDLEEERTGPPANIAFDDEGEPTNAARGFARGQGVDPADLYTVETDKGDYLAAQVFEKGKPAPTLLPDILSDVIESLQFPKSMRWASHKTTFGRPVRWILAIADHAVIPVEFAGVESGDQTYGHRFAAPEAFSVDDGKSYLAGLKQAHVVADPDERRTTIEGFLADHGQAAGGRVVNDPELIDEVVHLVEKPHAVTLAFDEDYLALPREVLISSMRSHQRYFAVEENDGSALRAACVVIYNTPVRDSDVVAHGNLKVLRARLDDARFFWDKDLETPLSRHREALRDVIWIAALGTTYERTERMAALTERIGPAMGLGSEAIAHARRAAELSKADLVTQVVNEFPDLQGIMGREYALRSDEPASVAQAIDEQYLPKTSDGDLPASDAGACVAIAEKLDALVGCFGVDMVPSSASDPYGLRRAALGILQILADRGTTASLPELVHQAIDAYTATGMDSAFDKPDAQIADEVTEFLVRRLRYLLEDQAPTDVVHSVLAAGVDDIPSVHGRIDALASLREEADFEPLALGFKRVVNILRKQADDLDLEALTVDPERLEEPAEAALYEAASTAARGVSEHLQQRRWQQACQVLIGLKQPVDEFFDSVMVMSDDQALRTNRMALLAELRTLFFDIADISKIQT